MTMSAPRGFSDERIDLQAFRHGFQEGYLSCVSYVLVVVEIGETGQFLVPTARFGFRGRMDNRIVNRCETRFVITSSVKSEQQF